MQQHQSTDLARKDAGPRVPASPAFPTAPLVGVSRATTPDEALVDRVRAGDRAAFDELYQRYFKRVYSFLDKRLRNRWDTEETTQEVFINVFASLDGYRGDGPSRRASGASVIRSCRSSTRTRSDRSRV
jgi:RNA polymerase sigma-70 factor (ECF subfamily)